MNWSAQAPSNIALIKYMGKTNVEKNLACNPSLSYTLKHLFTTVEISLLDAPADKWEPLENTDDISLSSAGQERFLKHLHFIKTFFNAENFHFLVRSGNNFPADCGLASSASSYAALTKAASSALTELCATKPLTTLQQAQLSRQGSGSSCRSFFAPWCFWDNDIIQDIELGFENLQHQVIIVSAEKKAISSSSAHQQVKTSLLFADRPARAQNRCEQLIIALEKNNRQENNWQRTYELSWQEFWDMHALFETSASPFGYMTTDTLKVLTLLRKIWQDFGDGPLITLDAGPNIHLLYRPDQISLKQQITDQLGKNYKIF